MKGKFEISLFIECETQEELNSFATQCQESIVKKLESLEVNTSSDLKFTNKFFDLTNSAGDEVIGSFNNTGNPAIEDAKERFARLYDLAEALPSNTRAKAMIKTAVQVGLLNCQQLFVKLFFLK